MTGRELLDEADAEESRLIFTGSTENVTPAHRAEPTRFTKVFRDRPTALRCVHLWRVRSCQPHTRQ
jgi:hypothetical protein